MSPDIAHDPLEARSPLGGGPWCSVKIPDYRAPHLPDARHEVQKHTMSFKVAAPTGRSPQRQLRLLGMCWKYGVSSPARGLHGRTLWGGVGTCFHRREWRSRDTALGLTRRTPLSECSPRSPTRSDPEAPTPCTTGRRTAAAKQHEPAACAEGHGRGGRRPSMTLLASPSYGRGN